MTPARWLGLCSALALAACGGVPQITSEVSSFPQWPVQRAPGRYVFDRLPSQDAKPERQATLEAACLPALTEAGFTPAAQPDQADVSVQLSSTVRADNRVRYDPFWSPLGPWGPYGPYGLDARHGHPGVWGRGPWPGFGTDLPYVRIQLDVLIRDRKGNQVLYETHAVHERVGGADVRLLAPLCSAALEGFPAPALGPRAVTVTIPPDNP